MTEPLSFGPWLKQRRRTLGLTQEELANRAACSLSTLRKIEAGDLFPSRELAHLLAVAVEVPEAQQAAFIAFARDDRGAALLPTVVTAPALPPLTGAPIPPLPPPPPLTIPVTTPPIKSSPGHSSPGKLPPRLTPFIGRSLEVAAVQQMLANPTCSLLTIVGPGGIGKTRLAQAVAQSVAERLPVDTPTFPDGVYFVSFVGVAMPPFMLSTVATALGITFGSMGDPKAQLLNYLSPKTMLLVLDNLEHLLEGVALLVEILQAAPLVKLLVTSRERLAVQGEWVFDLPPLATPSPMTEALNDAALVAYPAVDLFVERAQRTQHGFALSAENGAAVAQICRLVGGMPLALELAASWVHTLSCAEIADEITRSIDFLTVTRRDLPERQRSVRATFDYSWQLLTPEEQQTLRRLSVFRGGFQREAATAIAGASLPLLAGLVSKSLVYRTALGRYELHELVRQYAADHLQRDGAEAAQTRHAHADYFLGALDEQTGLLGPHHLEARKRLIRDSENLRMAWLWAAESGRYDLLRHAAPTLWYFYEVHFLLHEGEALFTQALHLVTAHEPKAVADRREQQVMIADFQAKQGWFQFRTGRFTAARPLLEQAVANLRHLAEPKALADALECIGLLEWMSGAFAKGEQYTQEALALYRRLGRDWWVSLSLFSLGHAAYLQGRYTEALAYVDEALLILRRIGEPRSTAMCITLLGMTTRALGRLAESESLMQEALALATALDDQWMLAFTQQSIGMFAYAEDDTEKAGQFLESALQFFRERNDAWLCVITLNSLGWLYVGSEQESAAEANFGEALQLAVKAQLIPNALNALVGLATVRAKTNPTLAQATLAQYTLAYPTSDQETKQRAEQLWLQLAATLTPTQLETAQMQAQQTTLDSLLVGLA